MLMALLAIIFGLLLLLWSADLFVDGSARTAKFFGVPPLIIGMVIVGFGTSMPEMVVSTLSAVSGNPGVALGNAYGSNIANIALILGVASVISPILVHSSVLKKELPLLTLASLVSILFLSDFELSRPESVLLLFGFAGLFSWTIYMGTRKGADTLSLEVDADLIVEVESNTIKSSIVKLVFGFIVLVVSSRMLVWGAVDIAGRFGVDDMIIGLTIVAIGTSLPELASSIVAARKGEHDLALGNIIGSNLFNTLAVVGIAGSIQPILIEPNMLFRDMFFMTTLNVLLFLLCYGFKGRQGRINRFEGSVLFLTYLAYTSYLVTVVISTQKLNV